MKRAKPKLSPERRAELSATMKRRHAEDPDFAARRGRGVAEAYKRRAQDPQYKKWRHDLATDARLNPNWGINLRASMRARWADPEAREKARRQLVDQRKDPAFERRLKEARWTPEARARQSREKRKLWAKRRGFDLPPRLRNEYMRLVKSKKLSPREAGIALGLIQLDERSVERVHFELLKRGRLSRGEKRAAVVARMVQRVMVIYRLTLDEILARTRLKGPVKAREYLATLMRKAGFSLPAIGRVLDRHHTTVLSNLRPKGGAQHAMA